MHMLHTSCTLRRYCAHIMHPAHVLHLLHARRHTLRTHHIHVLHTRSLLHRRTPPFRCRRMHTARCLPPTRAGRIQIRHAPPACTTRTHTASMPLACTHTARPGQERRLDSHLPPPALSCLAQGAGPADLPRSLPASQCVTVTARNTHTHTPGRCGGRWAARVTRSHAAAAPGAS